jgi:hypothetical protein
MSLFRARVRFLLKARVSFCGKKRKQEEKDDEPRIFGPTLVHLEDICQAAVTVSDLGSVSAHCATRRTSAHANALSFALFSIHGALHGVGLGIQGK